MVRNIQEGWYQIKKAGMQNYMHSGPMRVIIVLPDLKCKSDYYKHLLLIRIKHQLTGYWYAERICYFYCFGCTKT